MKAFGNDQRGQFEKRMCKFLRKQFPEAKEIEKDEFLEEVRLQVDKSFSYGLESEKEVGTYLVAAWVLGANFDEKFPGALEILSKDCESEGKRASLANWTKKLMTGLVSKENH